MIEHLRKLFDQSEKEVKAINPIVEQISAFEPEIEKLTDEQLAEKAVEFRKRIEGGETLDDVLPEAFAVVREAGMRTTGMRLFDVQMVGAVVLHQGRIAEMKTGEGKTIVAVASMYLNALTGKGAHLVTVNDYLARRDAVWMGPIYHVLGLSVGVIQGQSQDSDELGGSYAFEPGYEHEDPRYLHLRPCSRRDAYLLDITYGTNHEFGFDYLRDNMAFNVEQLSMRELNYAIIDEVDSILVDEARTPHIISGPSNADVAIYKDIDKIVKGLKGGEKDDSEVPGVHYVSDKKAHSSSLTEEGMDIVEEAMSLGVRRIPRQQSSDGGNRVIRLSALELDTRQVQVRVREVGVHGDRSSIRFSGILEPAKLMQVNCNGELRLHQVGREARRSLVDLQRLLGLSQSHVEVAQVVVGLGKPGLGADRLIVETQCLIHHPLGSGAGGQIVVPDRE